MSYNVANQEGLAAGPFGAIQYSDGGGGFLGTSALTINNISTGGGSNIVNGYFGSFYDTTNPQTATANTEKVVALGNTQITNGMSLTNNTITFQQSGTYNITATAMTGQSTGSGAIVYSWWKQNGSNILNSTTQIQLGNANDHTQLVNNRCISVASGDTLQLWWKTDSNGQILLPATGSVPTTPTVSVTITQISYNTVSGNNVYVTNVDSSISNYYPVVISSNSSGNYKANVLSNVYFTPAGSNVLVTPGNVSANYYYGNGYYLTGITSGGSSNLAQVVNLGNVTSNTLLLTNTGIGLVATGNIQSNNFILNNSNIQLGLNAGLGQNTYAIAIGNSAGTTSQGSNAIAIGFSSASQNQGSGAIAIGRSTAGTSQGSSSIAIGTGTGAAFQSSNCVAIGSGAASFQQGSQAIAIGSGAGGFQQGSGSIAIGTNAGSYTQVANSIVISAIGTGLSPASNAGLYVAPIRYTLPANASNLVAYNQTTKEVFDQGVIQMSTTGNVYVSNLVVSGSLTTPSTVTAISASASNVLTMNFANVSTGLYSNTLTSNITGLTLSNPVAGGQYTLFLTGGAATYYVSNNLGGSIKANWAGNVNVITNSIGQLILTYTGSTYLASLGTYS